MAKFTLGREIDSASSSTSSLLDVPTWLQPQPQPQPEAQPQPPAPRPHEQNEQQDTVLTINSLVQADVAYRAAISNATGAAEEFIQLVVYYNIIHRLEGTLQEFYLSLSEKSRNEPSKFGALYHQCLDFVSSIIHSDYPKQRTLGLKPQHRKLLGSFLTLIKSSPSFIASALLSMPDVNGFLAQKEPVEELLGLGRSKPLNILFYTLFTDAPELQRAEYFSSICSTLINNKRGEKFCIEVLDKFMIHAGYPFAASLEVLLLGILQSAAIEDMNEFEFFMRSTSSLESEEPFVTDGVEKLLDFFDTPAMESIPEGFLMFTRLLFSKVDDYDYTVKLVVGKYLFHRHLYRLLMFPEMFGILKSCFVNEGQRQRVLTPVFQRLNQLVLSTFEGECDVDAKCHVDSIAELISATPPSSIQTSFDLDAKFAAKSTETIEFYSPGQMVVLSPPDVITLYSSLFPFKDKVRFTLEGVVFSGPAEDCEWSLEDIRSDVQPVITQLTKHYKSAHPINEKWQVFQVDDRGELNEIDTEVILAKSKQNGHEPYAETFAPVMNVVKRAIERIVTDATSSPYPYSYFGAHSSQASPNYLSSLLTDSLQKSLAKGFYLDGNEFSNALTALKRLGDEVRVNNTVIEAIRTEKEQSMVKFQQQVAHCQKQSEPYRIHLCRSKQGCDVATNKIHDLRTKIWYGTEIRQSTLWNRAKEVAHSLTLPVESTPGLKRNQSFGSLSSNSMFFRHFKRERRPTMSQQQDGMFTDMADNKLSDRESIATKRWLVGQQIQNFCAGEERIHRFCCEVDDLVKRIMGDTLTNRRNKGHSLLSSSALFKNDLWKMIIEVEGTDRASSDLAVARSRSVRSHRPQRSNSSLLDLFTNMDIAPRRGSQVSAHENLEGNSQPAQSQSQHRRASSTDNPRHSMSEAPVNDKKKRELDEFILDLQMRLTGMIYSDIGLACWAEGSETDKWLDAPVVRASVDRHAEQKEKLRQHLSKSALQMFHLDGSTETLHTTMSSESVVSQAAAAANATTAAMTGPTFDYDEAYRNILHRLSVTPSPMGKLNTLYALEMLVVSTLSQSLASTPKVSMVSSASPRKSSPNTDAIAEELRRIFNMPSVKSKTLFRDLQFIAAFVPASVLDLTDVGKAFWDVSLAALSMKEETISVLVDTGSEIFQHCTGMITDSDQEFLEQWGLPDVAWLWNIIAKEGEAIGQRELAIMHLSHPQITSIMLAPLAKASDTFDVSVEDSPDMDKLDPVRMAVVKHWMRNAAKRGDNIATEYLMQQQNLM